MTLSLSDKLKNLPSTRDLISQYGLKPNKNLGQNFLFDTGITDQIVMAAGDLSDKMILEIGPGPGGLTRSLLASNAKKIFAVETDERCVRALSQMQNLSDSRLEIIHGDALRIKPLELTDEKLFVIANLPYNIGTTLLFNWLEMSDKFSGFVLMLQKEVVQRICAAPGATHYGKLSVLAQVKTNVEKVFDIEPDYFFPPPKVTSSVVRILPFKKGYYEYDFEKLKLVLNTAFGKRRKMLRTSLAPIFPNLGVVLSKLGIDETSRAEDLSVEQFCKLSIYE